MNQRISGKCKILDYVNTYEGVELSGNHKQPRLAAEGHTEVSGNLGRSLPLRSDEAKQNCKRKKSGPHTKARLDISYPRAGGKLSLFFYLQELSRTLNSGQSVPF